MANDIFRRFSLLLVVSGSFVLLLLSVEHFSDQFRFLFLSSGRRDNQQFFKLNSVANNESKREVETRMPVFQVGSFELDPKGDLEDVYKQDPPRHPSTCRQSLRNAKDEDFRRLFLPNIRLFMHKDNLNLREWNRLSQFKSPFGFMSYQYDDVMPSLKLIPKPPEPLLLPKAGGDGCIHCAVVGTGGILNGSRKGREIDAHDYVFRMNGAITKGYEDDVGQRTSVYVHTAHSMVTSLALLRKHGYTSAPHDEGIKYVMIPEAMRDIQWLHGLLKGQKVSTGPHRNMQPRNFYSGQFNESRFYVLHQDFLRYVRNRFLRLPKLVQKPLVVSRPTNGAFTIFLALQTCDTVNAYGFMTEDYNEYSNYYVDKHWRKVIFYANHNYIVEKNLWFKLHQSKIIKLYQRKDPETPEKQ